MSNLKMWFGFSLCESIENSDYTKATLQQAPLFPEQNSLRSTAYA
jgi:hypothetical protein